MTTTPHKPELPPRILLVEDNPVNQKMALRLLKRLGYTADIAGNGLEALAALRRMDYDIILMDVMMPEMDGLEATRRIVASHGAHERPKIIAITANALPEDRRACFEAGMDDFLSKPYRLEDLLEVLRADRSSRGVQKGFGRPALR